MFRVEKVLSNLSTSWLYFLRNVFGVISILLMIIALFVLQSVEMSSSLYNLLGLVIILMPWGYYWLAKSIDKMLVNMLVEQIDLDKYEAYWRKHLTDSFGRKALGVIAFYRGHFEDCLSLFEQSQLGKRQTKKARKLLENSQQELVVQAKLYLLKDNSKQDFSIGENIANSPYLAAIKDVICDNVPNTYFETSVIPKKSKLSCLLFLFYQAKNDLLLGRTKEARKRFGEITLQNPELYIVQEAKKKLLDME